MPPEWAEPPAEPAAPEGYDPAAEMAAESAGEPPAEAADSEAAAETGYAEPPPEPAGEFSGDQGGLELEGWVAPPAEPEPEGAGWIGQALDATAPLSAADLGTLASIGVDPNDGLAGLRLLAVLVRVLNRRQSLDPEEVRAEIEESRAQAAAAAEQPEGAQNGAPEGPPPDQAEPAET